MVETLSTQENSLELDPKFLAKAVVRLMKQDIIKRYHQTKEITDEDWEFCEAIDWHPVDELPMKESFIKEIEKAEEETPIKFNSAEEFLKSLK